MIKELIKKILSKFDLYDYCKIYKDKYFPNPIDVDHLKRMKTVYSEFIKTGNLCFDIGSNILLAVKNRNWNNRDI
jgi:hypothetical protein